MLLTSKGSAVPTQMHAAAILFHGSTDSAMFRQNGSLPARPLQFWLRRRPKKRKCLRMFPLVGEHAAHKKEK